MDNMDKVDKTADGAKARAFLAGEPGFEPGLTESESVGSCLIRHAKSLIPRLVPWICPRIFGEHNDNGECRSSTNWTTWVVG